MGLDGTEIGFRNLLPRVGFCLGSGVVSSQTEDGENEREREARAGHDAESMAGLRPLATYTHLAMQEEAF